MALSSLLNDKSLARFRTKPCERLVAKGHCSFGDRCQYSHASLPRRNPKKYIYSSELCGFSKCLHGDLCPFAHTKEEQLYHPEFYKTKFCELGASCREYYCPYAHSSQEKKNKAELLTPGAVPKPDADAEPVGNAAGEVKPPEPQGPTAPEGWWFVGDQKDLLVSSKGEVVTNFYGLGHSITGGYVRQAQILVSQGGTSPCVARLLSTSRGDATVANQVIKDIRRWIAHCHSSVQMIRRTVATTVLALPAELRCLDVVVKGMASNWDGHGLGLHNWGTTSLLSKWLSQITSEVANLHSTLRISHLSLGPCSVFLDPSNEMQMGDFLGKVQFLRNAQSGFSIKDDEWAMWYPAEVQKRIAQEGNLVPGSSKKREDAEIMDEYAVDAWQLGVLAFFLLTGEHPFGASNQPTVVCGNITTHRVANWGLMEEFPLWADLIGRLLSHDPTERLKVSEVLEHPLFWSFEEGSTFAKPLLEQSRESLYPGRRCAWLCHLPCFADFAPGHGRAPPTPPAPMLSRICGEALTGKKPKDLVHFLESMLPVPAPKKPPALPPMVLPPMEDAQALQASALRDAFDLGALAGAQIYAATFGAAAGVAAPPPGLWPPTPWADVASTANFLPGQELFPQPTALGLGRCFSGPAWETWQCPLREEFPLPAGHLSRGPELLDFGFFSEPGWMTATPTTPRNARVRNTRPVMSPEKTKKVDAEARDRHVKETLGSLLHLLDKCDETWTPAPVGEPRTGFSSEAIPI